MQRFARASGWIVLGVFMLLFYALYVLDMTYYNPYALWVMIFLSATIVILGVLESFISSPKRAQSSVGLKAERAGGGLVRIFPHMFALTFSLLLFDVILTLYAVSVFGLNVEKNLVVRDLLRQGNTIFWIARQTSPALVTGALYALVKDFKARRFLAAFTLGTLIYAGFIVANNAFFLFSRLSAS